ncbi:hypothetical protein PMI25_003613 [Pseudomonas sp. GM30]|nr:hypothetical protein PMI25_003613 [Pseudomonas sp. GM30]
MRTIAFDVIFYSKLFSIKLMIENVAPVTMIIRISNNESRSGLSGIIACSGMCCYEKV